MFADKSTDAKTDGNENKGRRKGVGGVDQGAKTEGTYRGQGAYASIHGLID